MRILVVVGTRPEAIKLAPVVHALRRYPRLEALTCTSGQHDTLLAGLLEQFDICANVALEPQPEASRLDQRLASMLTRLTECMIAAQPDCVVIQGDTTTTLAAGLAAFYLGIPIAHVEAGLRTGDIGRPWPEEANRRLVAPLARWHFAPTIAARDNLVREGIDAAAVEVTGNTGIDALHYIRNRLDAEPGWRAAIEARLPPRPAGRKLVLVTAHRRENFGAPLKNICVAVARLAGRSDVHFVFIVHPNPDAGSRVRAALHACANVHIADPLAYADLVALLRTAYLVLTDSGGVQEEAPSLGVPALVLREVTEREEGLNAGHALLVGTAVEDITTAVTALLEDPIRYAGLARVRDVYGDGKAAERVAATLVRSLGA